MVPRSLRVVAEDPSHRHTLHTPVLVVVVPSDEDCIRDNMDWRVGMDSHDSSSAAVVHGTCEPGRVPMSLPQILVEADEKESRKLS